MAQQLDFRPLDFRAAILADPVGNAISGTIADLGKSVAGTIRERGAKKEAIKKDFIEQMTFDTSITGNNIINNRVSSEYGKLREKYVDVLNERKGWLTTEDRINLRSEMQGLSNLANQLTSIQNMYDTARKAAISKDGRMSYDLKTDNWAELMSVVSGETDTPNLIGALNQIERSDTEVPFLDFKGWDANIIKNDLIKPFRQTFKGDEKDISTTVDRNGQIITTNKKVTSYGTDDDAKNFFKTNLLKNPQLPNYTKWIHSQLTPEEKLQATETYGPGSKDRKDSPLIEYYINNKMDFTDYTQDVERTGYKTKPESKAGGGGLNLFFGGGAKKQVGDYEPKQTKVQSEKFNDYVEFAKSGNRIKNVNQVTVKGAQLLNPTSTGQSENLTEPADYKVIGYDLEKDVIVLAQKQGSGAGGYYDTYMAPREGNEHFLQDLFSDKTMQEIANKTRNQRPAETAPPVKERIEW